MRIGIDLRDMAFPVVGVGQTTRQILEYIDANDSDSEYFFYQYSDKEYCSGINAHKRIIPVAPYRYLKEQVFFSALSYLDSLDVFHSPIHLPPKVIPGKTKVVFTVHDIHSELDGKYFPPVMNDYFSKRRFEAIERADAVIVHSEFVKREIIKNVGVDESKLKLVPCGVHSDFLQEFTDEAKRKVREKYNLPERFVLYVGSIEPWKQVPRLIREFLHYRVETGDNIGLVLVGRDGWRPDEVKVVRSLCEENDSVSWLNYVRQGDLPVIYSCAEIFSSASRWEGFGLIFLEAMGAGTPILAADKAAIPEVIGDAGICFDPDIKGDYGEKLNELLCNKELYQKLRDNCKVRVTSFGNKEYGKRVHDVYLSC